MSDHDAWVTAVENNVRCAGKQSWRAVQNMTHCLWELGGMSPEMARERADAALTRLATLPGWSRGAFGAKVRIAIQSAAFRALAGTPGSVNRVMPNADACWVGRLDEVIGYRNAGITLPGRYPLEVARHQDVERLFGAWSALDWDGTLGLEYTFERTRKQPAIRKRKWAELARLVSTTTSFDRLARGEKESETVTQLFAHEDATIDDKILLASQLANRAKGSASDSNTGMGVVVRVLAPHLAATERPMPTALRRLAENRVSAASAPA